MWCAKANPSPKSAAIAAPSSVEPSTQIGGNVTSVGMTLIPRSEEHTSELQSHSDLVCRLLLEKKKQTEVDLLPCVLLNLLPRNLRIEDGLVGRQGKQQRAAATVVLVLAQRPARVQASCLATVG